VQPLDRIDSCTLDGNGDLILMEVNTDNVSNLIRISTGLKPPAYLKGEPKPPRPTDAPLGHTITSDPEHLSRDLGLMLQPNEGGDVEMRCAGGEVVRGHSLILAARWEWFRMRQASGMTTSENVREYGEGDGVVVQGSENPMIVIDTSDYSASTMELVLQHLYTGRLPMSTYTFWTQEIDSPQQQQVQFIQQMTDLLTAANYFLLPDLHAAVLALARQIFRPKTALTWLRAAHVAKEYALEEAVLDYSKANMAGEWVAHATTFGLCTVQQCRCRYRRRA
jgi:hypothetical protein